MKKIMLLVISPMLLLIFFLAVGGPQPNSSQRSESNVYSTPETDTAFLADAPALEADKQAQQTKKSEKKPVKKIKGIVNYALSLIGTPYVYAGMSENGFDCSGFTTYVYDNSGIEIGRSSSLQADEGRAVPKKDARPGDLLIFTGTNKHDRTPGHVGIVISQPGDTISFVHSSSNGGVKISQVEGTGYDDRFLQVRRVLKQ